MNSVSSKRGSPGLVSFAILFSSGVALLILLWRLVSFSPDRPLLDGLFLGLLFGYLSPVFTAMVETGHVRRRTANIWISLALFPGFTGLALVLAGQPISLGFALGAFTVWLFGFAILQLFVPKGLGALLPGSAKGPRQY